MRPIPRTMFGLAALAAMSTAALAQQAQCSRSTDFLDIITGVKAAPNGKRYEEAMVAMALSDSGKALFRLYVDPKTRTFTLVALHADKKLACIIATGVEWQDRKEPGGRPT